jgi:hypothetical protein
VKIIGLPNWGFKESKSKKRLRRFTPHLIFAIVFSGLTFSAQHLFDAKQKRDGNTAVILHGRFAIDERDLRSLIVDKGLTVYWVGPKVGAKYLLDISNANGISLRYISNSTGTNGTSQTYYEVGTFVSQNAFSLIQRAALQPNGVGFINIDGNAVYYDSRNPTNVYIGLKNVDIQVEIYDLRPDQALAYSLIQGKIQKIN